MALWFTFVMLPHVYMNVVLPCIHNCFVFQDLCGADWLWYSAVLPVSTTFTDNGDSLSQLSAGWRRSLETVWAQIVPDASRETLDEMLVCWLVCWYATSQHWEEKL